MIAVFDKNVIEYLFQMMERFLVGVTINITVTVGDGPQVIEANDVVNS